MEIIRNGSEDADFAVPDSNRRDSFKAGPVGAGSPGMGSAEAGQRVITSIKPAVRDKRRVNIFVDGKFSFSLDIAQLADFKLKNGQVLSEEKLEELISASNFGKLYARTLEYVFSRPRSIREVRDHLVKKQRMRQVQAKRCTENQKPPAPISGQDIEKVITRLIERGYLDDLNFARYYVENRNLVKGISTKRLEIELRKKGVDEQIIAQVLAESPRDQSEEIMKVIEKKRRRNYDDQKLIQYLLRQGFEYELVRNLVLSGKD